MTGNVVALKGNSAIQGIIPASIEDVWRLAQYVSASGLAPQGMKTKEQVAVSIFHGLEIGLPPMQAIQKIAVINGRPSIWGDAIPALLWARGFKIEEKELIRANTVGEVNGYECTVTRPDGAVITRKFTEGDAKSARLWDTREKVKRKNKQTGEYYEAQNDSPWFKYPKRMLQMRARGLAARDGAADVLMGLYLAEEAQDIPPEEPAIDITELAEEAQPAELNTVGDRIRDARVCAGLTQEQLAEHIGVARNAVHKWENNRTTPRDRHVESLAKVLDLNLDAFNKWDDAQPEPQEPTELDELLSHSCFEPSDDRPNANHYKTKEDGGETWTELISAINDVENLETLKQLPDLYADEISGMPIDWARRVQGDIQSRYKDLTS